MINVYFIDEHDSSKQNGIGTYRDVLVPRLGKSDGIKITLISLNSDCDNLKIEKREYGYEYALPKVANGNWRESGDIIWPLLRLYIPDSHSNVFVFNHSPSADFIMAMKQRYPKSKCVFVIHDQGWCGPLFGSEKLLAKALSGKEIAEANKLTAQSISDYCKKEQRIYDIVDKVVCLSASTEKTLLNIYGLSPEKLVRIENGYETDKNGFPTKAAARKCLGLRHDEDVILFAARPVPHKGIGPLLRAMEIVRRKRPYAKCVLAGSVNGFANHWDLGKKVATNLILPGYQTADEMRTWYAAADVGVLSSYTEQCSYSALEMMNSGITIVSSNGNGLRDMFTDGVEAFVVPVGDVLKQKPYAKRLAQAINKALAMEPKTRKAMSAAARKRLRTAYSAGLMTDRYVQLFIDLLK